MKTGRLIMPALRWREDTGFRHEEAAIEEAVAAGVGGFILFGGTVSESLDLTDRLRKMAGRPLLFGSDMERGAGQQVQGLAELPPPAALAALDDLAVVREAGRFTGYAARQAGINWVFAPVADLDLEAANPIVQTRSFGSDPGRVATFVAEWIAGAKEAGVLTCAKHFPGHGRTIHDSHDRTPAVEASLDELERSDLVPFRAAIEARVDSVMTSHVSYPGLDPTGTPSTRSPAILGYLRNRMGFDGLIVSDALVMEGFAGGLGAPAASVGAVRAGVEILLYPAQLAETVAALEAAVSEDEELLTRVETALARYARALETVTARFERPSGRHYVASPPVTPAVSADREASLFDRVVAATLIDTEPPDVRLRAPIELVVVDDDRDGAFPPSPHDWLEKALLNAGVAIGAGGSRIVAAFAEPRASKGRAGFGERSREELAAAGEIDLIALFAHPRLQRELPAGVPVLQAWHRQRLMQEAVAAWIVGRIAAGGG